ncbi:hypothetical protein BVRB_022140, partial [Beta vulgaris subsp. vulgaris]
LYTNAAEPGCTDRHDIVADFADPIRFQQGLCNLMTEIDHSGDREFSLFQRVEQARPWNGVHIPMVCLKPRQSSALEIPFPEKFDSQPDVFDNASWIEITDLLLGSPIYIT